MGHPSENSVSSGVCKLTPLEGTIRSCIGVSKEAAFLGNSPRSEVTKKLAKMKGKALCAHEA